MFVYKDTELHFSIKIQFIHSIGFISLFINFVNHEWVPRVHKNKKEFNECL